MQMAIQMVVQVAHTAHAPRGANHPAVLAFQDRSIQRHVAVLDGHLDRGDVAG